jgi:hypothetical protein
VSVAQHLVLGHGQSESIIEFRTGGQSGIGDNHGTAKLRHQQALKNAEKDSIPRLRSLPLNRRKPYVNRCLIGKILNNGSEKEHDDWRQCSASSREAHRGEIMKK